LKLLQESTMKKDSNKDAAKIKDNLWTDVTKREKNGNSWSCRIVKGGSRKETKEVKVHVNSIKNLLERCAMHS
jgi:hypothetical protein